MAYVSQDLKKSLAPGIKAVLKKYKMKGTIGVENRSTLVVNIKEGALDVIGNANATASDYENRTGHFVNHSPGYIQVNPYWIERNYTGEVKDFLIELKAVMSVGNHNNSDLQSDYHDVGWYVTINVGQWNKPYLCTSR